MPVFRIVLTGDFLGANGRVAYGDIGLGLLDAAPYVQYEFIRDLAPKPGDTSYWDRLYSLEVRPEHIAGANGLVLLRPWLKREAFAGGAGDLVVVGRSGAGYDKVDLAACTEHDVAVFNAPHALNHATASSALAFMLALAKRLPQQDRVARSGRWDQQPAVMGHEIEGRTLGIIGLGHSGRELARLIAPFRMRLLAHSPHARREDAESLGVRLISLNELLRESDFVSLHCRLTPESRRMIGPTELALMKPTAYFINIARGELVDQPALAAALRERRIAGAALDVFEHEPLPADDLLTKLDNVILAPHFSCSTADIWRETGRTMMRGMLRAARGEVPGGVVNHEVLDRPGFWLKLERFAENAGL